MTKEEFIQICKDYKPEYRRYTYKHPIKGKQILKMLINETN
jgi:hypothetical protein